MNTAAASSRYTEGSVSDPWVGRADSETGKRRTECDSKIGYSGVLCDEEKLEKGDSKTKGTFKRPTCHGRRP